MARLRRGALDYLKLGRVDRRHSFGWRVFGGGRGGVSFGHPARHAGRSTDDSEKW